MKRWMLWLLAGGLVLGGVAVLLPRAVRWALLARVPLLPWEQMALEQCEEPEPQLVRKVLAQRILPDCGPSWWQVVGPERHAETAAAWWTEALLDPTQPTALRLGAALTLSASGAEPPRRAWRLASRRIDEPLALPLLELGMARHPEALDPAAAARLRPEVEDPAPARLEGPATARRMGGWDDETDEVLPRRPGPPLPPVLAAWSEFDGDVEAMGEWLADWSNWAADDASTDALLERLPLAAGGEAVSPEVWEGPASQGPWTTSLALAGIAEAVGEPAVVQVGQGRLTVQWREVVVSVGCTGARDGLQIVTPQDLLFQAVAERARSLVTMPGERRRWQAFAARLRGDRPASEGLAEAVARDVLGGTATPGVPEVDCGEVP